MTCFSIVEQGEQAYGKHVKKDNEEPVPDALLKTFLRIQNGADVRGVVLDGACFSQRRGLGRAVCRGCSSAVSCLHDDRSRARTHICISYKCLHPHPAGVEGEPMNLSLLMVFFIARGFATWLSRKLEVPTASLRVSIGMDSRISGFAVRYVLHLLCFCSASHPDSCLAHGQQRITNLTHRLQVCV